MADDVQLTDLEVISRFSLAVRSATASREDIVSALEADLAWLAGTRGGSKASTSGASARAAAPRPATRSPRTPPRATARRTPRRATGA